MARGSKRARGEVLLAPHHSRLSPDIVLKKSKPLTADRHAQLPQPHCLPVIAHVGEHKAILPPSPEEREMKQPDVAADAGAGYVDVEDVELGTKRTSELDLSRFDCPTRPFKRASIVPLSTPATSERNNEVLRMLHMSRLSRRASIATSNAASSQGVSPPSQLVPSSLPFMRAPSPPPCAHLSWAQDDERASSTPSPMFDSAPVDASSSTTQTQHVGWAPRHHHGTPQMHAQTHAGLHIRQEQQARVQAQSHVAQHAQQQQQGHTHAHGQGHQLASHPHSHSRFNVRWPVDFSSTRMGSDDPADFPTTGKRNRE